MISDVRYVTLVVADLEIATTFYRDGVGLQILDRAPVEGPGYERAWRLPEYTAGQARLMGLQNRHSGILRLVELSQPVQPAAPSITACLYRVRELDGFDRRVTILGATVEAAIQEFPVTRGGVHGSIADAVYADPDGALVNAFEARGNLLAALGRQDALATTEIQSAVLTSRDPERSAAFYTALGFAPDTTGQASQRGVIAGQPPQATVPAIELAMEQTPGGRITIVQAPDGGTAVAGRYFALSFETDDLDDTARCLTEAGSEPVCPPQLVEMAQIGMARIQTWTGPDNELIEIFEAQ
jgi:catechol 2,3-dioxygenase-like lactoylglutathione lyase family enzyme